MKKCENCDFKIIINGNCINENKYCDCNIKECGFYEYGYCHHEKLESNCAANYCYFKKIHCENLEQKKQLELLKLLKSENEQIRKNFDLVSRMMLENEEKLIIARNFIKDIKTIDIIKPTVIDEILKKIE